MKIMKRVQRKRTKGWRMPPNTVYVGRPTKYGNPYRIDEDTTREEAIQEYANWLDRTLVKDSHYLDLLKGKDLACWCPLSKPCHAEVLLKFLERKEGKSNDL